MADIMEMMGASIEKVKEIAGTETVIGDPIYTPNGTMILPVSKLSMGFATGGIDSTSKKIEKPKTSFGGGGGTGVTVTPIAFLVISAEGKIDLVPISAPQNIDTVDKIAALIERSPEIIGRIKAIFKKKEKDADVNSVETEQETE